VSYDIPLVNGYIATTDFDWFTFLRSKRPDEVNFWQPSGRGFRALEPGEPLFFKLKSPHNAIAGFGLFARHELATAMLAWDAFGELNGARTFDEMCARIEKYRPGTQADPRTLYRIGCIMLAQPVFFEDGAWVAQPRDWAPNTVSGAGYDLAEGEGQRIWEECQARAKALPLLSPMAAEPMEGADRYGAPQLVRPRLGQGTFRVAVTQAYGGRCAVSHEHSLPVLEAAHIQAYGDGGPHDVSNGLLLRADIHRLFDGGFVTVTPTLRFEVSARLREAWENGKVYYALQGGEVAVPRATRDRPDPEFLRWHNEHVFEKGIAA
jgi:putative restriction endonuclease